MRRVNVIQRHQYADYLNVTPELAPAWKLMGTGFTKLDESPGAQTETSKYVNEPTSSTYVASYETEFGFDAEQVKDEDAIDYIYDVAALHKTGIEAMTQYLRVELFNPVSGSANTFRARRFTVSIAVDDIEGETKQTMSGTLACVGDPVPGEFNTKTLVFAPDDPVYTAVTPAGTENPSALGWYEAATSQGVTTYSLSSDTTVDSEKTYYELN